MFRSPLADGGVIILLILLFAAPKRLPMLSRSIGESIKEFRGGIGHHGDDKHLSSSTAAPSTPASPAQPEASETRDTVA